MLQTVLGLDAATIAAACLTSPAAMGQRLVRAKAKIKDAGIRFEVPEGDALPERLEAVLEAVCGAYGMGWDAVGGAEPAMRDLGQEAVWLAAMLHELMPLEPEVGGLLALMLHCEARRAARRDAAGTYVPLHDQDPGRWDAGLRDAAERILRAAAAHGRPGRYQLEAAIQSAHAEQRLTGRHLAPMIVLLYEALAQTAPTIGVMVGHAAAIARAHDAAADLACLDELPADRCAAYQPFWALRADLLARLDRCPEAAIAFERAIGLASDPAVRRFLSVRRNALPG